MSRSLLLPVVAIASVAIASGASAQSVIASLDPSNVPTYQPNGFATFTFGDFPPPVIISQAPVLAFDITDVDAANGIFGGLGVDVVFDSDPGQAENQTTINFPAHLAWWEVRLRIGPDNEATAIRTTFIDIDGPEQDTGGGEGGALFLDGDEHVYEFDLTQVPDDGQFHTLVIPLTQPLFTQGAFGLNPGNGLIDPGLKQIQIQSVFDSTGRFNVDVEYARIMIPEPAAAMLVAAACSVALARRKNR